VKDVFSPAIVTPHNVPGHMFEITRMQEPPLYRAECSCGWWQDKATGLEAQSACRDHKIGLAPNPRRLR
jgi:hypothetical protein